MAWAGAVAAIASIALMGRGRLARIVLIPVAPLIVTPECQPRQSLGRGWHHLVLQVTGLVTRASDKQRVFDTHFLSPSLSLCHAGEGDSFMVTMIIVIIIVT